jgi:3-oxoacyl-[acyl-carrier-protein] synthase III
VSFQPRPIRDVYITAVGAYLPGLPIDNDRIENFLGLINGKQSRLKNRILKSNGIKTRHYALDEDGHTTELNEELAAKAVHAALAHSELTLGDVEMLAAATTQGDVPIPGFASMVHGRLGGRPMEILSAGGVCCSSMAALSSAYRAVATQQRANAVVVGSELVSRSLKGTKFGQMNDSIDDGHLAELRSSYRDFDADFLRWMLSDGAGSLVLEGKPHAERPSLRIDWIELKSYAHEYETCMYTGIAHKQSPRAGNTWLDLATISEADQAELMRIRQDTELLPQIVKLGVEEYLRLLKQERIVPEDVDHFLCHYSSHFFKGQIVKLLDEAGLAIPEEKWFTNLYTKGNTGAASIFIMLEEAMNSGRFKPGEKVLLMVPESGRFTVAFALLTCVEPDSEPRAGTLRGAESAKVSAPWRAGTISSLRPLVRTPSEIEEAAAHSPLGQVIDDAGHDPVLRQLVLDLAIVWADFERMLRATPIVCRIEAGQATVDDYKMLLRNLRQQVMEGARWIARAASNVSIELFPIRSMFISHARDEHRDFQMLERDYCAVGGSLEEIRNTPKNIGSEALSAFMFHRASQPDPLDLLGAMFVIEGLGRQKAAHWGEALERQLKLTKKEVSFLHYHGANDDTHFGRLREVLTSGIVNDDVAKGIVKTAKVVARLYALQLEELDNT